MKRRDFLKFSAAGIASLAAPRLVFSGETRHESVDGMPQVVEAAESFAVLPDTQTYAYKYPELFLEQTRWIAENRKRYNIRFALHVGDVTEHNDDSDWGLARRAMGLLDNKVPYAICLGNHDMGPGGSTANRDSLFGKYFPMDLWKDQSSFGGVYDVEPEKPDNSFHRFHMAGEDWLVLSLEFGPRDDVLRWANEVTAAHPNHKAILLTHGYLMPNGARYDKNLPRQKWVIYEPTGKPIRALLTFHFGGKNADLNDGQMIWDKLVSRHSNFAMVFCGHVCTAAHLESVGQKGNRVHQFMVDYQHAPKGGDGWMRLCQTTTGNPQQLQTTDLSPSLNRMAAAENTCFQVQW